MRHRKKKHVKHQKQVHYRKVPANARKVPGKGTQRLAAATLVLAVLGGGTTAAWVIHKVNQYPLYSSSASTIPHHQGGSGSSVQNSPGPVASNPPSGPKITAGSGSATGGSGTKANSGGSSQPSTQSTTPPSTQPSTGQSGAAGSVTSRVLPSPKGGDANSGHRDHNSLPTKHDLLQKMMKKPFPTSKLIHVDPMSQLPQLQNGCEVTSLSMLLQYIDHPINKMKLASEEPRDKTPLVKNKKGQVVSWGNPNVGFVGNVTGKGQIGYGIYHGPFTKFINELLPGRGLDLTGMSFKDIEAIVAGGTPVEVWDTATLKPTNSWVTWQSPEGPVKATFQEHAVLLVGYNKNYVFINNPLNGKAAQKVPVGPFIKAWDQLGQQAVTIAPEKFRK